MNKLLSLDYLGDGENVLHSGGPLNGEAVDGAEEDDSEGGQQLVQIPRPLTRHEDGLQEVFGERQRHGGVPGARMMRTPSHRTE